MKRFNILYARQKHNEALWAKPETIFEAILQQALEEWILAVEEEKRTFALKIADGK